MVNRSGVELVLSVDSGHILCQIVIVKNSKPGAL